MNSNPGREILKNRLRFGVNTEYKTDLITSMNFNPYCFSLNRVPTRMEFGECIYDFDIIDVAERSPLNYLDEQNRRSSEEQGSFCQALSRRHSKFSIFSYTLPPEFLNS